MEDKPAKIRAFIGIYPSEEIAAKLEGIQDDLKREIHSSAVRWTKTEQLHLTLQFLGYLEASQLPAFENLSANTLHGRGSFELCIKDLGCFPNVRRSRVLWAGLGGELASLEQIKNNLDKTLSTLGYIPEDRPFHAHITLARIGEIRSLEAKAIQHEVQKYERQVFGTWRVNSIDLIQSLLSPAGAKYQVLRSFPLT